MPERVTMPIQPLVLLTVLQVSVPVNMSRELPLYGGVRVSVVVRVGVQGALLHLVVVSLVHRHIRVRSQEWRRIPAQSFYDGVAMTSTVGSDRGTGENGMDHPAASLLDRS
jgi:hypothetical protein